MSTLDRLEPLIEPAAVSAWPPAPGWWALAVLLSLLAVLVWHKRARKVPSAPSPDRAEVDPFRQSALDELAALPPPYGRNAAPWLQQLNALLKRVCKARYPDQHSQTLSGRAWLAYLDTRCTAAGLTRWMILVDGAYRADCRLDDRAIDGLQLAVETWIRKHA
ncbi:DUF4381 domain-containing protein [Pseudomonas matsuisoli]|uniref:DUF4381 domain-containing protein n=1 Tax=Pseudomonas matsuisoli TaxID=1515666 RepID=A0A917UTJ1_9PSED|nr:DUF4381 domain-containing protein [Pseudomonas matsuisoli]GGJ84022.1 hypothetical protein GCM10009304_07540 [Pseudomonas matsuisoli]